jgi:hypothetical protein
MAEVSIIFMKKNDTLEPNFLASVKYGHILKQGFWNSTLDRHFQKPFYPLLLEGFLYGVRKCQTNRN